MADGAKISRALLLGASVFSIALLGGEAGNAQTADTQAANRAPEQKQSRRKPAKPPLRRQARR